MEERRVPVRGDMFAASITQEGAGPPLLFLHSLPVIGADAPGLQRLAARYTVIAPQHPGFGASSGIEHVDDILDLAGYYLDLLDELGIESLPVVGHGFGGMIALEMAAMDRHRVPRLVLVSPIGLWLEQTPSPDPFTLSSRALAEHIFVDPERAKGYLPERGALPSSEEVVQFTQAQASLGKFIWPLPDKGLRKRIHRVKAPALILWGDRDRLNPPAYGEAFRALLPNARLDLIPDASSMLIVENPDAFADATLSFLSQS